MMTDKELLVNALKRVNALAAYKMELHEEGEEFFLSWEEPASGVVYTYDMPVGEVIAYLHGMEDGIKFMKSV